MNTRERFHAVLSFEPCDRTLLWEFGYWGGAVERWYEEGLPRQAELPRHLGYGEAIAGTGAYWGCPPLASPRADDVSRHLNLDANYQCVPLENWVFPRYEEEILAEEGDNIIFRDKMGITMRKRKDDASRPEYLSWPVTTREDWERLKEERFALRVHDRLPGNWPDLVHEYKTRDFPLVLGGSPTGYFGSLRFLMGEMRLLTAYYDDPDLVHDIAAFLTEFWIELYGQVLQEVEVDSVEIWEDMCYKNGPLISPHTFQEFMSPYYKKLTGFLRDNGVRHFIVDTDGDCSRLISLFTEAGVTGLGPFEVQAGMDVRRVREQYPQLQIMGGLDKTKFAASKDEIDKELESKLPFLLERGGYIPYLDHLVPPDVSWENYVYFRERVAQLAEQHNTITASASLS